MKRRKVRRPRKRGRPRLYKKKTIGKKHNRKPVKYKKPAVKKSVKNRYKKTIKMKRNFVTFDEAKAIVRDECIGSSTQYTTWWIKNIPDSMPKTPNVVYKKDWKSWNDFLGTNNKFQGDRQTWTVPMPYKDAEQFAQKLKLTADKKEWLAYIRNNGKPKDMPTRPDLVYKKEWISWSRFLGTKLSDKIENLQKFYKIFYILKNPESPNNVYVLGISDSEYKIYNYAKEKQYKIIKCFKLDESKDFNDFITKSNISKWSYTDDEYTVPNIFTFILAIKDGKNIEINMADAISRKSTPEKSNSK